MFKARDPDRDQFEQILIEADRLGEMTLRDKVNKMELTLEDIHQHVQYGMKMPDLVEKAKVLFAKRNSNNKTPTTEKRRLTHLEKEDLEIYLTKKHPTGITFCNLDVFLGPLIYQANSKTKLATQAQPDNVCHDEIVKVMLSSWSRKQNVAESAILYQLICDKVRVNDHILHIIKNYPEEVGLISKAIERGDITFPSLQGGTDVEVKVV